VLQEQLVGGQDGRPGLAAWACRRVES
jgi:hypothetical protein